MGEIMGWRHSRDSAATCPARDVGRPQNTCDRRLGARGSIHVRAPQFSAPFQTQQDPCQRNEGAGFHPTQAPRPHLDVNLHDRSATDSYGEGEAALGGRKIPTDERHPLWCFLRAFDPERAPWYEVGPLSPIEPQRDVQRRADLDLRTTPHEQAALCPEPATVVIEVPAPRLVEVSAGNLEWLAIGSSHRYRDAAFHDHVPRRRILRIIHRLTEGDDRFGRWIADGRR